LRTNRQKVIDWQVYGKGRPLVGRPLACINQKSMGL
jgi:hypothetical protein